jgi:hypothetical protein
VVGQAVSPANLQGPNRKLRNEPKVSNPAVYGISETALDPARSRLLCHRDDRGGARTAHLWRRLRGRSRPSRRFFPNIARRVGAAHLCPLLLRDEHRLDDASLSCWLRAAAQTKITKRTQGRPSCCARGVCPRRPDEAPLNLCQNYETNPRPPILVCPTRRKRSKRKRGEPLGPPLLLWENLTGEITSSSRPFSSLPF